MPSPAATSACSSSPGRTCGANCARRHARTFVTDLAPRWQAIRTRFDEVLAQCEATLSLDTAGVDYALGCDSGIASQWRDLWCNVGAGAVFGYLQQAYQPARDRQALAWDAARAL